MVIQALSNEGSSENQIEKYVKRSRKVIHNVLNGLKPSIRLSRMEVPQKSAQLLLVRSFEKLMMGFGPQKSFETCYICLYLWEGFSSSYKKHTTCSLQKRKCCYILILFTMNSESNGLELICVSAGLYGTKRTARCHLDRSERHQVMRKGLFERIGWYQILLGGQKNETSIRFAWTVAEV